MIRCEIKSNLQKHPIIDSSKKLNKKHRQVRKIKSMKAKELKANVPCFELDWLKGQSIKLFYIQIVHRREQYL